MQSHGKPIPNENWLNVYDREIHDAIVTLNEAGNNFISVRMILNVLAGRSVNRITEKTREYIEASIVKMMNTQILINASDEAKAFKAKDFQYSGELLPCRFVERISLNNNLAGQCIEIVRPLPLMEYAKLRRQFSAINSGLLKVLTVRPEHLVLKLYLLRELVWLKNAHSRRSNIISLETISEYLGLRVPDSRDNERHQRKTIRDNVLECLEFWKTESFIKGYILKQKDRRLLKLEIEE